MLENKIIEWVNELLAEVAFTNETYLTEEKKKELIELIKNDRY